MLRLKHAVFAAIAMSGSAVILLAVLLAADLYAHSRVERSVGVNRQGYRGPVVPRKAGGETRVVMLGGSTVFGFGVEWEDTIPAILDRRLQAVEARTRVINLGFIGEGAITFVPTLKSYAHLDYDIVCLYEGYNDVLGDAEPNHFQLRHASPVFRMTGYFPILPLVLREKAMSLRHGNVAAAYEQQRGQPQVVFRPGLAQRTSAAALDAAAAVTQTLGRQLERFSDHEAVAGVASTGCAPPWSIYCQSVTAAARFALAANKSVIVVSQPRLLADRSERHASQQRALAAMLARDFRDEPRVRYVDASGAVDLSNVELAFDGLHLTRAGNERVAGVLLEPMQQAVRVRRGAGTR